MIVIKINKCPFSLLIAISITKESPSKPRPWQAKARISKIESLFSCLLVPLHCTRSRNTRSLLQNLIRSTKGPGKARFYLKPLVEVNQAIIAWSFRQLKMRWKRIHLTITLKGALSLMFILDKRCDR